ncbi:hypothetical protein A7982_13931 [Minicystis rosea]|nr:hypothetical protein A7982_13931 [Minicystis rosea]
MNGAWLTFRRISALAGCLMCSLSATACSYATVGSGEIGVVWTPHGKPRSLPEGQWGLAPTM